MRPKVDVFTDVLRRTASPLAWIERRLLGLGLERPGNQQVVRCNGRALDVRQRRFGVRQELVIERRELRDAGERLEGVGDAVTVQVARIEFMSIGVLLTMTSSGVSMTPSPFKSLTSTGGHVLPAEEPGRRRLKLVAVDVVDALHLDADDVLSVVIERNLRGDADALDHPMAVTALGQRLGVTQCLESTGNLRRYARTGAVESDDDLWSRKTRLGSVAVDLHLRREGRVDRRQPSADAVQGVERLGCGSQRSLSALATRRRQIDSGRWLASRSNEMFGKRNDSCLLDQRILARQVC